MHGVDGNLGSLILMCRFGSVKNYIAFREAQCSIKLELLSELTGIDTE